MTTPKPRSLGRHQVDGHKRAQFAAYVQDPSFPCVGARSAFNTRRTRFGEYQGLGDGYPVDALRADLEQFSREFPDPGHSPVTFIAMFGEGVETEEQFVRQMWQHLQKIDQHDCRAFDWDPAVSSDPSHASFSFFLVGLSPVASRLARRAPMPCLVFNFHNQFESLRASGKFASMQKVIRKADVALQGSINPVLAHFGEASEARQYSGEAVADDWECPFRHDCEPDED
jgi:uncharacterized protein